MTEIALKAIPKGSFRIDSVPQNGELGETKSSNKSFHSQFIEAEDNSQDGRRNNLNIAKSMAGDSNYLNFTNKSFK